MIGSVLGRAGETGHSRRLADARRGVVPWETPLDVQRFMTLQRVLAEKEAAVGLRDVNSDKPRAVKRQNKDKGKDKDMSASSAAEEKAEEEEAD